MWSPMDFHLVTQRISHGWILTMICSLIVNRGSHFQKLPGAFLLFLRACRFYGSFENVFTNDFLTLQHYNAAQDHILSIRYKFKENRFPALHLSSHLPSPTSLYSETFLVGSDICVACRRVSNFLWYNYDKKKTLTWKSLL